MRATVALCAVSIGEGLGGIKGGTIHYLALGNYSWSFGVLLVRLGTIIDHHPEEVPHIVD